MQKITKTEKSIYNLGKGVFGLIDFLSSVSVSFSYVSLSVPDIVSGDAISLEQIFELIVPQIVADPALLVQTANDLSLSTLILSSLQGGEGFVYPIKLTNNNIQLIKKHTFQGILEQSKYLSDEQLKSILEKRTFFTKKWSFEQVMQYSEEAYNILLSQGKTGLQSIEIHGEIINVFIKEDGTFDTAYGIYKFVVQDFR